MKLCWLVTAILLHVSVAVESRASREAHVAQWRISRANHDGTLDDFGGSLDAQPIITEPRRKKEKEAPQALRGDAVNQPSGGRGRGSRGGQGRNVEQAWKATGTEPVQAPTFGPLDPRGDKGRMNVLCMVAVTLVGMTWWYIDHYRQHKQNSLDPLHRDHKNLPEDIYGFAIASIVRDCQMIAKGDGKNATLRYTRLVCSILMSCVNVGMLLFMILQIKTFVTAKWVHDIRVDYDQYEVAMYEPGMTTVTANGYHRGIPGHLVPANFNYVDHSLKERICNIPFSQGAFFHTVLLIWGLTCVGEVRQCLSHFMSLIMATPVVKSMGDALVDLDEEVEDGHHPARLISGLTVTIKFVLLFFVIIPRLVLTCVLLWLGSRFLAATNDFCEMVLNAAALEFLLMLKDLLYFTIVPDRNKREVENIQIKPSSQVEHASWWTYLGTFSWLFVAFSWNMFYVYLFQTVLPDYRWDVASICTPWLDATYGNV